MNDPRFNFRTCINSCLVDATAIVIKCHHVPGFDGVCGHVWKQHVRKCQGK